MISRGRGRPPYSPSRPNYLTLATAEGQLAVQKQNLAAQEAQEQQLQTLVKAGARSISDLYQQQATTASARAGVVSAEQDVELARIALIQTLQLDPRGSYDFVAPTVADVSSVPHYDLDSLLIARLRLAQRSGRRADARRGGGGGHQGRVVHPTADRVAEHELQRVVQLRARERTRQPARSEPRRVGEPSACRSRSSTRARPARPCSRRGSRRTTRGSCSPTSGSPSRSTSGARIWPSRPRGSSSRSRSRSRRPLISRVETTQARYQVGTSSLLELTQARASQLQANDRRGERAQRARVPERADAVLHRRARPCKALLGA